MLWGAEAKPSISALSILVFEYWAIAASDFFGEEV
jgi:hypothetical protein